MRSLSSDERDYDRWAGFDEPGPEEIARQEAAVERAIDEAMERDAGPRRISIERMAEIWRCNTPLPGDRDVAISDVDGLVWDVDTFAKFLEANRGRVQLFEEDHDGVGAG